MKFENIRVMNFENAFRGMRNPKNSWHLSDSAFGLWSDKISIIPTPIVNKTLSEWKDEPAPDWQILYRDEIEPSLYEYAAIGPKDMKLAKTLVKAGSEHRKFMRQIFVSVDITAPLYIWKEIDTYKVGTVANSCSTMHTITKHPITIENISTADLREKDIKNIEEKWLPILNEIVNDESLSALEKTRILSKMNLVGFEQKRTIKLNYQVIKNMNVWRMGHKLKEWRVLINVYFKNLPYVESLFFRNPYLKNK